MYDLLCRFLPARLAGLALVGWYLLLLGLVVLCLHAPQGVFRYAEL